MLEQVTDILEVQSSMECRAGSVHPVGGSGILDFALWTLDFGPCRFVNLVKVIRLHVLHEAPLTTAPGDLNAHPVGGPPRGEDPNRIISGHIPAATNHLL